MPPYTYPAVAPNPYAMTIGELLLHQGDIEAQRAVATGTAWAGAAQGVGNAAAGAIQLATDPGRKIQQQDVEANQRTLAFSKTVNGIVANLTTQNADGSRTLDRTKLQQAFAQQNIPLPMQQGVFKSLDDVDASVQKFNALKVDHLADVSHGMLQSINAGADPQSAVAFGAALAKANGLATDEQLQPFLELAANDAEGTKIKGMLTGVRGLSEKYKDLSKPIVLPRAGATAVDPATGTTIASAPTEPPKPVTVSPGASLVNPTTGQPVYTAPDRVKPPTLGSAEDYIGRYATEHGLDPAGMTAEQTAAALKEYRDSTQKTPMLNGMNALYTQSDPKALAAAIMRGDLPPDTARFGRPIGAAVETELANSGYHLSTAVTDWKATQKHVATLNGPQQTRLNQSINALPDLLDSVDTLAGKWNGGSFPLLNKANLALAKGGAYGKDVASVATQLDSQIADVVADLGTVYMGGNTPTDHALQLAQKSLSGDWSASVLRDMVKLARSNVTIRRNSMLHTGVQGASEANPYVSGGGKKADPLGIRP